MLPIGGVARLEKLPTNPLHELWVALAGPAVNIVIAAILFVWVKLSASFEPFQMMTVTAGPFFERMLAVNLLIIAFFVWIGASREARVAQMQSAGNT